MGKKVVRDPQEEFEDCEYQVACQGQGSEVRLYGVDVDVSGGRGEKLYQAN